MINALILVPRDPELIAERAQAAANVKGWDKTLTGIFGLLTLLALVVVGLDRRFNWTVNWSSGVQIAGLIGLALGFGFARWAMLSNRFFSGCVRIQQDRGHTVETAGPYRFVRHPGYVGIIAAALAAPLLLGSLWAFIVGVQAMDGSSIAASNPVISESSHCSLS